MVVRLHLSKKYKVRSKKKFCQGEQVVNAILRTLGFILRSTGNQEKSLTGDLLGLICIFWEILLHGMGRVE
jgi:hypothetical protein